MEDLLNTRFDIPEDEKNDDFSNDDLFNITSWGADPSVRELISMYDDGDILKPELQRNYVWDKKEASRFVESILLGLPVPSIFLANSSDEKKLIIDGFQRVKTIYDFYKGIWSKDGSLFKLTDSERINIRWRNHSYLELSEEDKRRFRMYTIHAIVFEQKSPRNDDGLFQVFERINTSGKVLNAQEIRNCVSQGDMNTLLFQLNTQPKWRLLFGSEKPDDRMLDLEYILRFLALNRPSVYNLSAKSISLKKVLNEYMNQNIRSSAEFLQTCSKDFINSIEFIHSHFGVDAFYNLQNDLVTIRRRFNPTVYDSIMIATSIALNRGFSSMDNLEERRIALLKDIDYRSSITQGTMQLDNIRKRIDKALNYLYHMSLNDE